MDVHGNEHPLTIDHFTIIDHAKNKLELSILESLYIFEESSSLNVDISARPLKMYLDRRSVLTFIRSLFCNSAILNMCSSTKFVIIFVFTFFCVFC